MPLYASGRRTFDEVLAKYTSGGNDPADVAKVIVAAATDRNPKLRRTAGSTAALISALHRVLPVRIFDRIIRRFNRMPNRRALRVPRAAAVPDTFNPSIAIWRRARSAASRPLAPRLIADLRDSTQLVSKPIANEFS